MDMDDTTDDIMAQMGFSSFGGQTRPQKKRRYNPRADAVQDAPSSGTGANSTALGQERPPAANADEIDLEDDDPTTEPSATQAQVRPASLPQRPAPGTGFVGGGQKPAAAHHPPPPAASHEGGGSRAPWYEGYYDHLSNENPWERLEKTKGLESKGSWLPRGSGVTTSSSGP